MACWGHAGERPKEAIESTLPHAHAGARQVNPDRVQVASSGIRGSDTSPFPPWHLESTIYRCIEPSRLLAWGSGQIGTLAKAIKPFHHSHGPHFSAARLRFASAAPQPFGRGRA